MSDTYYRDFRDGESHRFTTDLVDSQVPEYLQEEGPLLIKMIEEYYNFLHTGGNPESAAKNLIKLNDIDEVNDYYTQYLKDTGGNYTSSNTAWTTAGNTFVTSVYNLWRKQYLLNVPQTTESFELLVKNSLQLFRAKGSVQGFEALFRGIYGLDSEIKTPWNQTFKASEGDWNYDEYLQCNYTKDIEKFTGLRILGKSSGGSAIVQRVNKKLVNGRLVAQLVLSDIGAKPFEQNEIISTLEFPDIQVRVQTGIKEIILSANGSEFALGEIVNIDGNGIEGRAIVNEVDDFEGRLSFTLVTKGSGYRSNSLPRLIGGVGGAGGEYAIGSVGAPLTALNISQEQVGFLASNTQIQIGEANSFISNGQVTQTEFYANAPLAGPSVSNGLNISWSASSNTATLEADVANNTFTNGSIWFLGNTTPGSDGDHTPAGSGMVVHDYNPGTSTITFTSQTTAAASTNTAVIRQYAANTVYIGTSNLASATYQSALEDVLDFDSFIVGAIQFIATVSTGRNYVLAPTAQPIDTEVYALRIQDGAGGFLGNNANVNVQLLANNVITRLSVLDHGFGYTNASAVTLSPDAVGGSTARGIIKLGGVARTEGGWTTTESFTSSNQRIHDSYRYQAFSYEVVTQESYVNYNRSFRAVSHPAGSEMFGVYQTQETGGINLSTNSTIEIFDSEGGVEIANNSSAVLGTNTTFGGSSTIVQGDKLNLGSLTFTVNSISSNTNILANNILGVTNSQVYTTSPFSANVTLSGNLVLINSNTVILDGAPANNSSIVVRVAAGGDSITPQTSTSTANGTATTFTSPISTTDENLILVTIDGIMQQPQTDYTVSGTTVTLDEAPANNSSVVVRTVAIAASGSSIANQVSTSTANGTATSFTSPISSTDENEVIVTIDGVLQTPQTDYTISGTTVTLDQAPANNSSVVVRTVAVAASEGSISTGSGDGSTTVFTSPISAPDENSILVLIDGVLQTPQTDYSVSSRTVTGLDTKFVRDLKSGYKLYFDNDSFIGTVESIQSNTSLKLMTSWLRNSNNQSNVYIVYPDQVVLTGNVTITADTKTITGNETLFQQEIKPGDVLLTQANVRIGTVNTITSNTSLVLSNTYTSAFPTITNQPGVRILFNRSTYQPYKMSGEISAVHNGRNITGIHSQFENELQRGDQLYYEANGLFIGMVNRIQSNTSANLVNTYYAPDGANLTDAVVLRRHKLSKLIEE